MFTIIDNSISKEQCEFYRSKIDKWYSLSLENGYDPISWESRVISIRRDKICQTIKSLLETKLQLTTKIQTVELQCWPKDSYSELHRHDDRGREKTDYNSILYLNDDFDGGEFYTENGIVVKPVTGRLTFFNGSEIKHGLNKVLNRNRYTIIFWWTETKFK